MATNVVETGQLNGAGDVNALFKLKNEKEVLKAFHNKTMMLDKIFVKKLSKGEAGATFPLVGDLTSIIHVPGADIEGQDTNVAEVTIKATDTIVSSVFIDKKYEKKTIWDIDSLFNERIGYALADRIDKDAFKNVIIAANSTSALTGGGSGSVLTSTLLNDADPIVRGNALLAKIKESETTLHEKNVFDEKIWIGMRPAEYGDLKNLPEVISSDYTSMYSIKSTEILTIGNINVFMSNNVPSTDLTGDAEYGVNATDTKAVVFTKSAIGLVVLEDVEIDTVPMKWKNGKLHMGTYLIGFDVLQPECAIQIKYSLT